MSNNEWYDKIMCAVETDIKLRTSKDALIRFYTTYEKELLEKRGTRNHHSFVGGLLAHTYEVELYCKMAVHEQHIRNINTDILYASAIWHDVGKLFVEDEGLSNHAKVSENVARKYMMDAKCDSLYIEITCSCILEHTEHGVLFESKCRHKYAESRILHAADSLSAFAQNSDEIFEGVEEGVSITRPGYGTTTKSPRLEVFV